MPRFDQDWCDDLANAAGQSRLASQGPIQVLYVITDTSEGKVAFVLTDDGTSTTATAGKLPRGEKADLTVTAKEVVMSDLWAGERTRDEAFMAGDIKIEGPYARWLDEIVGVFDSAPWSEAWAGS